MLYSWKLKLPLTYLLHRTTLQDRVSGRVLHGAHSGPQRYLTDEEEEELVRFIFRCTEIGYSRTRTEILATVQMICERKGLNVQVSSGWWDAFRSRHPSLSVRMAEGLGCARVAAFDNVIMDRYYDMLEDTLKSNALWDLPAQIFNCDETGMPLNPGTSKVAAAKGAKHPYQITSGNKAHITVLACTSAAGYAIPPMVIFDRRALKPELTLGEVPGTFYGLSDSGWIDTDLFHQWFMNHFLRYAPSCRPLLLLLDGHSAHYQPAVVRMAAEEGVIVFCLPPHTTHVAQPLDNGPFASLKSHWKEACREFTVKNPGQVVTRFQFSALFCKAYAKAMTIHTITADFRTTGVYPFNRHATVPRDPEPDLAQRTGLAYIPMFSPERRIRDVGQQHHHSHTAYQPDQGGVDDSLAGVPEPAVISHGLPESCTPGCRG